MARDPRTCPYLGISTLGESLSAQIQEQASACVACNDIMRRPHGLENTTVFWQVFEGRGLTGFKVYDSLLRLRVMGFVGGFKGFRV